MSDTATHLGSGKVRELYALDDDRLLLVASDRISVFDVVLPTEIPDKGRVLTGLSGYWFAQTAAIVPNHLLALRDDGRSTECQRLDMLTIECVVRGYLSGSGWKDYRATGAVCGHVLPEGLIESQQLPEPIFTPATKAQTGHDENIDRARRGARRRGALRRGRADLAGALPLRFEQAAARGSSSPTPSSSSGRQRRPPRARRRGVHADSSRFWPADEYAPADRNRRSTSNRCATTPRRLAGTRPTRPGCRTTSSPVRVPGIRHSNG